MGQPIHITDTLSIDVDEIEYKAITSSGPGGQNVNKNMTAIQLRFDIVQSPSLPHDVQQRLIHLGGARVNNQYQLVITAKRHRSQERNKREAFERLLELLQKAARPRPKRLKKRPGYKVKQERLKEKRYRAETKVLRRRVDYSSN